MIQAFRRMYCCGSFWKDSFSFPNFSHQFQNLIKIHWERDIDRPRAVPYRLRLLVVIVQEVMDQLDLHRHGCHQGKERCEWRFGEERKEGKRTWELKESGRWKHGGYLNGGAVHFDNWQRTDWSESGQIALMRWKNDGGVVREESGKSWGSRVRRRTVKRKM